MSAQPHGLPMRVLDVQVQAIEQHELPPVEGAVPQVALALIGMPATVLDGGRPLAVQTFLDPAAAVQVGEAIAEAGRACAASAEQADTPAAPSGLVIASPADARAVAEQAAMTEKMRRG